MSEKDFVLAWLLACAVHGHVFVDEEIKLASEAYKQLMEKYDETNG